MPTTSIPIPDTRATDAARDDLGRMRAWMPAIRQLTEGTWVPPEVFAGIVSRESRGRNVDGDYGHGRGLAQIDDRYHADWVRRWVAGGRDPVENLRKGVEILNANIARADRILTSADKRLRLRVAVAAYNASWRRVLEGLQAGDPDRWTTGGNYSRDVLERATVFRDLA